MAAGAQSSSSGIKTQVRASRVFPPLFDRALVKSRAAESAVKDDVMPLEKAPGKLLRATKVAVPRMLERLNRLV